MNLRTRIFAALAGAAIIVGACQAATPSGGAAAGGLDGALVKRSDIKIEIVTHGQAADPFWSAHPMTRYPVLRDYLSGYRLEGVVNGDTIYRRL